MIYADIAERLIKCADEAQTCRQNWAAEMRRAAVEIVSLQREKVLLLGEVERWRKTAIDLGQQMPSDRLKSS
jgi:hypothetical protein